jgi:superfamily II DNA or RNA helicase/predicted RNA methylase
MKEARSTIRLENLQEILDASSSAGHALRKGQAQYCTPDWMARACVGLLPWSYADAILDMQCGDGALLRAIEGQRFGLEIDNRAKKQWAEEDQINGITASCVMAFETLDEINDDVRWDVIVANPPFGLRWQLKDGSVMDSMEWTWQRIGKHLANKGAGFMIGNAATLERLKIHRHPWVYCYNRMPAAGVWDGVDCDVGIVHFHRIENHKRMEKVWPTTPSEFELTLLAEQVDTQSHLRPSYSNPFGYWERLHEIIEDEKRDRPAFNIYLGKDGLLRTYLSVRAKYVKFTQDNILKLARINNQHPLTLTTDRETRKLLRELVDSGVYTIQPEASAAITQALEEVNSIACPIRPVTDFELVAYTDEEDRLKALDPTALAQAQALGCPIMLTPGKTYEITTGTYTFKDQFTRKKVHFDEETGVTTINDHECELSGADRYIEIIDDLLSRHRFMDRPTPSNNQYAIQEHTEDKLWQLFEKPMVKSIADVCGPQMLRNISIMETNEMVAGFKYFVGQLDYYGRMGCKDYGLVAADVGTGKTLGALTLVAIKSPKRTLIIAPQGTMRSSGDEGEIDYQASQWVQEINRFAPTEPVFQLFCVEDWHAIVRANGELPAGIYVTYPQAYFSNGAFEHIPDTWEDQEEDRFCKRFGLKREIGETFHEGVGQERDGIRCVALPSLHTQMVGVHGPKLWDMGIIDEAHLMGHLESQITKNVLRWQPQFRFAMTATPIPNIITNIFSLMGWLCIPDWHKGDLRSAAWPYAVNEVNRFNNTFLATETDLTARAKAKAAGKKSRSCAKISPVISSPARLLKLLKPTMAYISKEDCNPNLMPCQVIDVRVPMGKEQEQLYAYWLDRANYMPEFNNPLTIAAVQTSRLRGVCASPATLDYTRGKCRSNFNPKMVTILQLVRDCMAKGEQVVIVSARVGQSDALSRRLTDAGVAIARIDSTVPAELHTAEANRFKRGDARVMLMGIKCAQGHSFDRCSNLIVGSLEWTYGSLHQAKGRVWRLTSWRPVTVWCVLHKNSIEELLFDRVALKQDAATLCLHGKRVPRDYKTLDPAEVLAEHIVSYRSADGEVIAETECESQWTALRRQMVLANVSPTTAEQAAVA